VKILKKRREIKKLIFVKTYTNNNKKDIEMNVIKRKGRLIKKKV
jgi:hypothetical protein